MKGIHIHNTPIPQISPDLSLSDITSDDNVNNSEEEEDDISNNNIIINDTYSDNDEDNDTKTFTHSLLESKHPLLPQITSFNELNSTYIETLPHKSITSQAKILHELLHTNSSYFSMINARKTYERFIYIGISPTFLSEIEDIDSLDINPRITFNFPNNDCEQLLQSNIVFLKNSCFKDAVKVKRFFVASDEDFYSKIFERNFFAGFKNSFCLLQPISPEDEQKYFIYGVQFDDLYIINMKNSKKKNVFVYEKTYLFIAKEPMCKLYESVMRFIMDYKKLNFYQHLEEGFESLGKNDTMELFSSKNNEESSETILEVLQFFNNRSFPKYDEYINFQSSYSSITMNYKHYSKSNETFMAVNYLCPKLFKFITGELLHNLIIKILTEQNCLIIGDNIEQLTAFAYEDSFSY